MDLVEENFPRGGKKANTTPISARKRKTVTNDNLFDLHRKKDGEVAKNSKKKKKKKISADKRHEPMKEYDDDDDDDDDDFLMENQKGLPKPKYAFHSDILKMKNISEGMLLLGCIKEVRQYEIIVSLPGGLSGYVEFENLNQVDTNTLKKKGEESYKLLLVDLYPVGLAVRCRVLGVFETRHGGRSIKLSLKPQDVNSGLSATILHPGMVLSGCVSSVEDHGYIVDIGVKISAVFLSKAKAKKYEEKFNGGRELAIGQPVFCVVDEVKAGGRMVQLSAELPVLLRALATVNQGWTLYTLLPGLVVEASVTKVTRNAVMLEFLSSFEGIVDLMHLPSTTGPSVGDQVKACVLYVHPTKRLVGLSLHPKLLRPAPSIPSPAAPDLGTIQHDCTVTSYLAGTGVFLTLGNGTKVFAKMKDLLDDVSVEPKTIFIVGSKHSCRLLDISPIDQTVIVSLKRSVMEAPFLFLSDLHIGQIVEGKVLSVDERGMFVHLGDYLRGFVPWIHLADVPLSHPERRFNPDEIISCKVLNLDHKRCAAVLTCKPTLLASQFPPVCSREAAIPGTVAHGCVICVRDFGIVVQLLGDVRGVILRWQLGLKPHKKPSDAYYLGQVLKVCVSGYDAYKDQILFSLETAIAEERQMAPERLSTDDHRAAQEEEPQELQLGSRTSGRVKLLKPCHALITLPGGQVGRLHVSELLNSVEPGCFPMQSLKVGQKITTTVIGNWKSKKSLRTSRLELSFRRRKLSSKTQDDLKSSLASYRPGQKVMCFVQSYKKQQKAVWVRLAPTVRGKVERLLLDLRPKVAKCPGKYLKRGQAVEGKVIARRPRLNRLDISLSGFHKPIPGSLTLAFVQEVNPTSGLVLELPQCKVGKVGLTEMADCYSDQPLAGFAPKDVLLCCILAKDEKGIFVTSLRTSHISPEVAEDALDKTVSSAADVVEGSCMRGYVQRVSARNIFITLSWTLKGRLSYRNLSQYSVNEAAIFKKHLPLGRLVTVKVISVNGETGLVELSALPQDTGQDDLLPESLGLPLRGSTGNGATKDADKVIPQKNKTHASVKEEPLATVMVNDVPFTGTMAVDEVTMGAVTVAPDKRKRKTVKQTEEESAFDKTVPLKVTTVSESADVKKGKKTKQKSSVAKAVKNVTAVMNRSTEEVLPEPLADKSPALENMSSANVANKRKCEETQMESNSKGGLAKEDWTNMKDGGDSGVDMYIQVGSDDRERKNEKIQKCNQGKRPEQKAPRLQLDEGFVWDVTAADLHVPMANADDSSSGDDADAEACTSQITGRRMTRKEQLREERKLACREREMADPTQVPQSVDDFERLLLGSPNSSLLWVQFMAFHLQSSEVEQARAVAERALRTISFREEQEKLNVWVALLNLENMYGSEENLNSVFQRALRYNDALKVYHRLVQIYTHSDKPQKAEALYETMVRKFRQEKTIWVNFGMLQMQRGQMESVRSLLQRALKCLPDRDHIEIIVKFAQLHFRSGGAAHGISLLENVVTNFPRRTDVWSIYLDMLIKYTTPEQARQLFERAINMDAHSKQMKFFFKRYMDFERSHGDEQKVQYVRQQALNYVEKQSNLLKDG